MTSEDGVGVKRMAGDGSAVPAGWLGRVFSQPRQPIWRWANRMGVTLMVVALGPVACGPPDCTGWNGGNFLEVATRRETARCVKAGMDVQARDNASNTPLHRAAGANSDPAVIEMLLEAGADIEARNDDNKTPLHAAAQLNENPAVAQVLLRAGANVEALDGDGETPVRLAAGRNSSPAVVEALIKAGADTEEGRASSALYRAVADNENPEVAIALLETGLSLEFGDLSPLHLAAEKNENRALVEALIEFGFSVDSIAYLGTPLHVAARNNSNPGDSRGADRGWRRCRGPD